jgi:hypothetical protein
MESAQIAERQARELLVKERSQRTATRHGHRVANRRARRHFARSSQSGFFGFW